MFNVLRTRKGKLKNRVETELEKDVPDIKRILSFVDEYERANLDTITKLKRKRSLDLKRISGALKQTLNAHGDITSQFIGSAAKRIYGGLLENKKEPTSFITKILNAFKNLK